MEKWLKSGNWHNYDKLIGPLRIVWQRMSKNVHSKFRNFVGAWERGFFEPFLTDDYARSQHFSAQILTKHVTLEPKVTITIVKPKRIRNGGPENAKPEVRYSVYTKIHIYNKIDILRFYICKNEAISGWLSRYWCRKLLFDDPNPLMTS